MLGEVLKLAGTLIDAHFELGLVFPGDRVCRAQLSCHRVVSDDDGAQGEDRRSKNRAPREGGKRALLSHESRRCGEQYQGGKGNDETRPNAEARRERLAEGDPSAQDRKTGRRCPGRSVRVWAPAAQSQSPLSDVRKILFTGSRPRTL